MGFLHINLVELCIYNFGTPSDAIIYSYAFHFFKQLMIIIYVFHYDYKQIYIRPKTPTLHIKKQLKFIFMFQFLCVSE